MGNIVGVGAGLLGQLGAPPGNKILGWMAPGLGGGLGGGGTVALVYGIVTLLVTMSIGTVSLQAPLTQAESWTRRVQRSVSSGIKYGLLSSIIIGVFAAGVFALSSGPGRLYYGAGFGLFCGLIVGALSGMITGLGHNMPSESRRSGLTRLVDGMTMGVCAWLSFAVVNGWFVGFDEGVTYGAVAFLLFGVVFSWGHGTDLIRGLGAEIQPAEFVAWSVVDIRRDLPQHIRKGLVTGLAITASVIVLFGLASALFHGIAHGLAYGLVFGPIIGIVVAVAGLLTGILNSGWSSKLLEGHQLVRPNDGMRHSLRNAAFAACLFGPIGGLVSGLICGLGFGLIGGLSSWPILATGFGIIFTCIFAFAFAIIRGGAACIEHYLLRWHLWHAGHTPKDYIRFLDYAAERILLQKVGGGYMFAHRLLLDYFAALDQNKTLSGEDPSQPHAPV